MLEESISTIQILKFIGLLVAITGGMIGINRQFKRERERYATKDSVKQQFKAMDERVTDIEKDMSDNEKLNREARKEIKNDITKHFDTRFEDFKTYMRDLIKSN